MVNFQILNFLKRFWLDFSGTFFLIALGFGSESEVKNSYWNLYLQVITILLL